MDGDLEGTTAWDCLVQSCDLLLQLLIRAVEHGDVIVRDPERLPHEQPQPALLVVVGLHSNVVHGLVAVVRKLKFAAAGSALLATIDVNTDEQ